MLCALRHTDCLAVWLLARVVQRSPLPASWEGGGGVQKPLYPHFGPPHPHPLVPSLIRRFKSLFCFDREGVGVNQIEMFLLTPPPPVPHWLIPPERGGGGGVDFGKIKIRKIVTVSITGNRQLLWCVSAVWSLPFRTRQIVKQETHGHGHLRPRKCGSRCSAC